MISSSFFLVVVVIMVTGLFIFHIIVSPTVHVDGYVATDHTIIRIVIILLLLLLLMLLQAQ
jgi:hypothetical protein